MSRFDSGPCAGQGCDGDASCDCFNTGWESAYDAAMQNGDESMDQDEVDRMSAVLNRVKGLSPWLFMQGPRMYACRFGCIAVAMPNELKTAEHMDDCIVNELEVSDV